MRVHTSKLLQIYAMRRPNPAHSSLKKCRYNAEFPPKATPLFTLLQIRQSTHTYSQAAIQTKYSQRRKTKKPPYLPHYYFAEGKGAP
jgi:hypothetical protein